MIEQWNKISLTFQEVEMQLTKQLASNFNIDLKTFYLLHYLYHEKENCISITQLQYQLGLSQSATSRLIQRLEQTNTYVDRHQCTKDKRTTYIELTSKGCLFYEEIVASISNSFDTAVSKISNLFRE